MKAGFVLMSLGFVVLVGAAGCGAGKIGDYCDKATTCEGGNDQDKAACIDQGNAEKAVAGDYKCSDAYDSLETCMVDSSTCVPNPGSRSNYTVARDPVTHVGACDAQATALHACEQAATAYK
jgi:hypothetical protein